MSKFHIKRGDLVVVISGSHKGKEGKILEILAPKSRARVEGVAMMKRHLRSILKARLLSAKVPFTSQISCSNQSMMRVNAPSRLL
jgi:ribosomal protein L24